MSRGGFSPFSSYPLEGFSSRCHVARAVRVSNCRTTSHPASKLCVSAAVMCGRIAAVPLRWRGVGCNLRTSSSVHLAASLLRQPTSRHGSFASVWSFAPSSGEDKGCGSGCAYLAQSLASPPCSVRFRSSRSRHRRDRTDFSIHRSGERSRPPPGDRPGSRSLSA